MRPYLFALIREAASLQAVLEPVIAALGYELLGCVYVPQRGGAILRVYIDSPAGITVTDCERASRQLSAVLDVEDLIAGRYSLEVSSPGVDRPLFTREHFERFIGAKATIRLQIPVGNHKHFKGLILEVTQDAVIVEVADEKLVLPFTNIVRANLLPEYERKSKGKKT
jgi:ribosome maturation factor RimP